MKRLIAVILCAAALIAVFAGCRQKTPDTGPAPDDTDEYPSSADINYEAAFGAFAPDTVMMNIGDYQLTWEELFYFLFGTISNLTYSEGDIYNWNDTMYTGETYAGSVLYYATDSALKYKSVEYGTNQLGITLGPVDFENMQNDFDQVLLQYGNEEEFLKYIWDFTGCRSRELYDYLIKVGYLANNYFKTTYGESGELLSDETIAEYTVQDEYLMAKHILRLKPEDGDYTALQESEDILKQLKDYKGNDFDAFFDQLMFENSEDEGGLESFSSGYLFQYYDMVEPFSEACKALKIGEYSEIVESEFGYHIIYRIPINNDTVPSAYANAGEMTTLRHIVAIKMFDEILTEWSNSLSVENTASMDSFDIATIFKIG